MGMMETASRLIAKYGQAATLLRPGEGTQDDFGGYTPGPDAEYPVTIMPAAYAVELRLASYGFVNDGEMRVLLSIAGLTVVPETTDRLRIGGDVSRVKGVTTWAPSGPVLFYELATANE